MRKLLVLALVLSSCSAFMKKNEAAKEWTTTCGKIKDGAHYCSHQKVAEPTHTILYFHGLGDTENAFTKSFYSPQSLNKLMALNETAQVVLISYHEKGLNKGYSWLITPFDPRTEKPKMATVKHLKEKDLPAIKKAVGLSDKLHVVGISMGGANVATMCLAAPELFKSCTLINPMLIQCNPWKAGFKECLPGPVVKGNFTTELEWLKNSPFALADKTKTHPPMLITACKNDEFKLYPATLAFKEKISGVTFIDGGDDCTHFQWPAEAITNFIKGAM